MLVGGSTVNGSSPVSIANMFTPLAKDYKFGHISVNEKYIKFLRICQPKLSFHLKTVDAVDTIGNYLHYC